MILSSRMGFENDQMKNLDKPAIANQEVSMKPKITYALDFLLSLRELDCCKQLPNGFDKSTLDVFHDAFHCSQEKTRTSGSFAASNFRQTECSTSPPTRRNVNSYSRGSTGKWEIRSRDIESQTDQDSDSGRHIGNPSRRQWQNSEQEGLLGSGSSPKLTGYTSGTSAPKFRSNDQPNIRKSNSPYQPQWPYKAVPHSRISTNDLHNDKTFGSTETTTEDNAEERKRRAEFEQMRKKQHNSGQVKHLLSSVDSKDGLILDAIDYKGNLCGKKKIYNVGNESLQSSAILDLQNSSIISSTSIHTPASRPVVPPGFGNNSSVAKSTIKHDAKIRASETDKKLVYSAVKSLKESISGDKTVKPLDDPRPPHPDQSGHSAMVEPLVDEEGLDSKIGVMQHNVVTSGHDFAVPVLEDVFHNSFAMNGSDLAKLTEHPDGNLHDKFDGSTTGSSKFAHWFIEGDGKAQEDCHLSEKPEILLSLIGGPTGKQNSDDAKPAITEDTSVPVLTCEDLEQSILSDLSNRNAPSVALQQGSASPNANVAQPKVNTDALASHHLLSLLQKGPDPIDDRSSNEHNQIERSRMGIPIDSLNLKQRKSNKTSDMGKNHTLEALFGSAFMKELQVNNVPISTKNSLNIDSSRFQLPEKENLIYGSYPLNTSKYFHRHADPSMKSGNAGSHLLIGNIDSLRPPSAMFSNRRSGQGNQPFPGSLYEKTDMNKGRPMFNQLEAHRQLPQMRFPDSSIHHDQPLTHSFSQSRHVLHQPRPTRFDPIMQQAHLQSNAPPLHLSRQYSGSLPQSSNPYNQVNGFKQEFRAVHHHQPGFGGLGMSPSVSDSDSGLSNHHQDMVQRLMEMELKSKEKPKYHFSGRLGGLPNF